MIIWENQKFYSIPPKNEFLAKKRPNLAQNWHFWPNIGIFGPFGRMPDQNTMGTSCLGVSSVIWVPKLLLTPVEIKIFGQKRPIWPKTDIFGQILAFLAHLVLRPPKTMRTSCLGGFPLYGYQNFHLLPFKLGVLDQKRPNLALIMHLWSFWAKYWHFWPVSSHARPKNNANKVPRWLFRYVNRWR